MAWHVGANKEYGCIVAANEKYPLHILGSDSESIKRGVKKLNICSPLNDLGWGNSCLRNLTEEEYKKYFG
jgi:hypothetical protein